MINRININEVKKLTGVYAKHLKLKKLEDNEIFFYIRCLLGTNSKSSQKINSSKLALAIVLISAYDKVKIEKGNDAIIASVIAHEVLFGNIPKEGLFTRFHASLAHYLNHWLKLKNLVSNKEPNDL